MQNLFSIFTIIFCISTFGIGAAAECGVDQSCLGNNRPAITLKPTTEAVKESTEGGKPDTGKASSPTGGDGMRVPKDAQLGDNPNGVGNRPPNLGTSIGDVKSSRTLKEAKAGSFTAVKGSEHESLFNQFLDLKDSCQYEWKDALNQCNENRADEQMSKLKTASTVVDTTAPLVMGMVDSCSMLGKTLQSAQGILAGFRANCAIQKGACDTECSKTSKAFKALKSSWTKFVQTNQNVDPSIVASNNEWLKEEASASVEDTYASHQKDCAGQEKVLADASRNIITFGVGVLQSQNCQKELAATKTDVCQQYPNLPTCMAEVKLDCTIAENKKKRECICEANARDPICKTLPNVASKLNGGLDQGVSDQSSISGDAKSKLSSTGNPLDFGGSEGIAPGSGGGPSASDGSGSGSGLAGGGGSGGSQNGDSGQGQGGSPRSKVDTNVGFASGSGGGYSGAGYQRGSYSGYNRRKPSNYGAYLPGGELDPTKNKAGNDGMTGSHGPTLFDKVGGRYRDNRGTLISD